MIRARSRTDAFDLYDLGLNPIRETFYSSLEASKQALIAIGESASAAAKIVNHFERHDLEQLEASRKIRNDMSAIVSLAEKGRRDLKVLLALEQVDIDDKGQKS